MRYFIILPTKQIQDENNYEIVKVKKEEEQIFLEKFGAEIIAQGNNLMEALICFLDYKMDGWHKNSRELS